MVKMIEQLMDQMDEEENGKLVEQLLETSEDDEPEEVKEVPQNIQGTESDAPISETRARRSNWLASSDLLIEPSEQSSQSAPLRQLLLPTSNRKIQQHHLPR